MNATESERLRALGRTRKRLTGRGAPRIITDTGSGPIALRWRNRRIRRDRTGNGLLPPKIRELIASLQKAGFVSRGGKGSHRKFIHPDVQSPVIVSGNLGDDALHYQEKAVRRAIKDSKQ